MIEINGIKMFGDKSSRSYEHTVSLPHETEMMAAVLMEYGMRSLSDVVSISIRDKYRKMASATRTQHHENIAERLEEARQNVSRE